MNHYFQNAKKFYASFTRLPVLMFHVKHSLLGENSDLQDIKLLISEFPKSFEL